MQLIAATGNKNKLRELAGIFPEHQFLSAKEAGFWGDVEETGATFRENALLKARTVCKATGKPALADDSGLCVDALNGAPGVYSARYSGGGDAENRKLLLKNLEGVENRRAHFVCCIALVFPDGKELVAEGRTEGQILTKERGAGGFGYDSLFLSDDLGVSFAEASEKEKNAVSHRGRAINKLREML